MIVAPTITERLPALPSATDPPRPSPPLQLPSLLSYQDDDEAARQVRYPQSSWRTQVRQAVSRAVLEGGHVPSIEAGLISDVDASTDVPRPEAEAIVRQDVAAAVAAVAPRKQAPELLSPMPSGAEHASAILPAGVAPTTEPTVPSLALPRPTPDDEGLITTLPAASDAGPMVEPSAMEPAAPQGWLAEPSPAPSTPQLATPPVPTTPTFPEPAAVAPPAPGTEGLPWLHLGAGVGMAAIGIYLLTKRKKG